MPLVAAAAAVQLTVGGTANSFSASVSDNGQRVVFYSASNLTGNNADTHFEVFLYDRPGNTLRQITNDPRGGSAGSQAPQISGDGSRIVYQHFERGQNNTSLFQAQAYDINSASFTTLTPLGFFQMSDINRDGTKLSVNVGNLGLSISDTATGSFGAVQAPGALSHAFSGDGKLLTFATQSGGLSLRDVDTGLTTTILSNGAVENLRPSISADGKRVAFTSNRNLLGQNGDGNTEVYLYDVASASLRQLTNTTTGNARSTSISGDSRRIAFSAFSNPLGNNADGNEEIFTYDLDDGLLTQVTQTSGSLFNFEAALSANSRTLLHTSNSRASGGNGSTQIFLQDLLAMGQPVSEPPTLLLVASMLMLAMRPGNRAARTQSR